MPASPKPARWRTPGKTTPAPAQYVLRLYVTGTTPKSVRAITNLQRICAEHLEGRYTLEVIDIYQHPTLLAGEQILAAPTLVKHLPAPMRHLVGDMSNTEKVLLGLELRKTAGRDGCAKP